MLRSTDSILDLGRSLSGRALGLRFPVSDYFDNGFLDPTGNLFADTVEAIFVHVSILHFGSAGHCPSLRGHAG
jgi:hypothetical protein